MSGLDLTADLIEQRYSELTPNSEIALGIFEGFLRGTGQGAVRSFARTGSAMSLGGSVLPILKDTFTGGTTAQDRYFKRHEELWGSAMDVRRSA